MCVWLLVCVSWSVDSEGGVSVTVVIYERAQLQAAQCRILFSDTDGSLCRLSGRERVCARAGAAGEPGPAQSINGRSVQSQGPGPPHTRLYCGHSIANEHRPSWDSLFGAGGFLSFLSFEKLSLNSSAWSACVPTLHLPQPSYIHLSFSASQLSLCTTSGYSTAAGFRFQTEFKLRFGQQLNRSFGRSCTVCSR